MATPNPFDQFDAPSAPGLRAPGNIDLTNRPRVKNPDGSVSTVLSMSIGTPEGEVLIPRVSDDGRVMNETEAVLNYRRTGKHLGIFDSPDSATAYAQQLHNDQAKQISAPGGNPFDQFDAPAAAAPRVTAGRGGMAPTDATLAAMRDNALTRTIEGAAADPVGTARAGAAGVNRGVAQLVGVPVDFIANGGDLLGSAYGATMQAVTGTPGSEFYEPIDRARLPFSGEFNANMLDRGAKALTGETVATNETPNNPAARLAFATGQAIPGALTARQVAASAAGGVASDVVAEAGGDPAMQAAAGLLGNRAGERRAPAPAPLTASGPPRLLPRANEQPPPRDLSASGQPRALPREPEAPPAPELTASGSARPPSYGDLEGAPTSSRKPPKFADQTPVAHNGAMLDMGEQARRKDILRRVGVTELRHSAVQGNAKAAATDFQTSKLDNPAGEHLSRVLTSEREALGDFAERIAEETGGTRGIGGVENLQRGQNIIAPLDGIKEHFDARISALYKVADARAKGKPFQTAKTREIMADESEFLGTVEGEALLRGTKARMTSLGILGADGTPQRATVKQAERMKQWLGEAWTPRTSRLVKRLKDAIDDDVAKSAGEDIYARARSTRAERARILDDPNGIAKIMDAEGPQEMNRAVAVEKIPDVLTTLPVAQFSHIVKTLTEAPAELRGPAQAAIAEIKSQFANKVHEIGTKTAQWNAKGVSKYLNDNSARLSVIFSPAELRRFNDLNNAGHILRYDSSYPGAAVQAHNLKRAAVVEHGMTVAGTGIGAFFGGPVGGVVGAAAGKVAGDKYGRKINDRAALKAARARTTDLREDNGNALGRN